MTGYRPGCMAGYSVVCTIGNLGNCLVHDLHVVAWVHAGLLLGVFRALPSCLNTIEESASCMQYGRHAWGYAVLLPDLGT